MNHLCGVATVVQVLLDLKLAANIARGHQGGTCGLHIFRLALTQAMTHLGLSQVVSACRATTYFGFFKGLQLQAVNQAQ